jgi:hypothetical protein
LLASPSVLLIHIEMQGTRLPGTTVAIGATVHTPGWR